MLFWTFRGTVSARITRCASSTRSSTRLILQGPAFACRRAQANRGIIRRKLFGYGYMKRVPSGRRLELETASLDQPWQNRRYAVATAAEIEAICLALLEPLPPSERGLGLLGWCCRRSHPAPSMRRAVRSRSGRPSCWPDDGVLAAEPRGPGRLPACRPRRVRREASRTPTWRPSAGREAHLWPKFRCGQ